MLRIDGEKAQPRELVDGSLLKQAKLRVRNTTARDDLYVHLNALSGMGHLLIRLWLVSLFGFGNIPSLRITRNRLSGQRV